MTRVLQELASIGIDLDDVTSRLEADGVCKFVDSYDGLLATIAHRRDFPQRELLSSSSART